ncbi:MAG: bifunctional phosphoribosylaminoimidazolecarboxamide formyltransferase/IMP cyclohydrolase [Pseudomonadota bacterium]
MSTPSFTLRRALISVSDKRGLIELGRALAEHQIEILSTGGSASTLRDAGIEVTEVSEHTGFPEVMSGRVKTLHPKIHGGILARAGLDDAAAVKHDLPPIDLVVVNLYPFADSVADPSCTFENAIENIDIGGPAMLRAAAKNHARVTVLCDPGDYAELVQSLPQPPDIERRCEYAIKAFAHTAQYDGQISQWLSQQDSADMLPGRISLNLDRKQTLRYGENPHQSAGLYVPRGQAANGLAGAEQLQGKALSYNNLLDANAAWQAVSAFTTQPACVIVKHTNPCGAALGNDLLAAYRKAHACDPTSAFGGILAFNRELDAATAEAISSQFAEVILAPAVSAAARAIFQAKPNVRVLIPAAGAGNTTALTRIDGGWLAQTIDSMQDVTHDWRVVSQRQPTESEWQDLQFAWAMVKVVRSNAIVLVKNRATIGIGAGQMSRVDSSRIAGLKAQDQSLSLEGSAMASDAFFPFADGVETAAKAGVSAVIQPGGSKRDDEVVQAADAATMAMVLTGRRHFRH